jgi:hypothetical protein
MIYIVFNQKNCHDNEVDEWSVVQLILIVAARIKIVLCCTDLT